MGGHEMVGLSVILENFRDLSANRNSSQVISKGSMIKPSSPCGFSGKNSTLSNASSSGFLQYCSLCKQRLLPNKDIYMYKGDRAFCSVECRCRQIFMDEEAETIAKTRSTKEYNNCSLAAMKKPNQQGMNTTNSSPSSSRCQKRWI